MAPLPSPLLLFVYACIFPFFILKRFTPPYFAHLYFPLFIWRPAFLSLFSFLNFDAPICLSYILPFLLSHRPSVLYYFAFLFVLCGAPSFTSVAVCLRLYIPIFALLSFLLQFLSFKVTFLKLGPNCVTSQILKDLPHFLPLFI